MVNPVKSAFDIFSYFYKDFRVDKYNGNINNIWKYLILDEVLSVARGLSNIVHDSVSERLI